MNFYSKVFGLKNEALDQVARVKIYIELIETKSFEDVAGKKARHFNHYAGQTHIYL
jgi:hypothetical protein